MAQVRRQFKCLPFISASKRTKTEALDETLYTPVLPLSIPIPSTKHTAKNGYGLNTLTNLPQMSAHNQASQAQMPCTSGAAEIVIVQVHPICTTLSLHVCMSAQALGSRPAVAALEELAEAGGNLTLGTAEQSEHADLLDRLRLRIQAARSWEASAAELLAPGSSPATLDQLEVCIVPSAGFNRGHDLWPKLSTEGAARRPAKAQNIASDLPVLGPT